MKLYRSILAAVLIAITVFTSSLNLPSTVALADGASTPAAQVQQYVAGLKPLSDRLPELESLISAENWVGARAFIRGPLGELGPIMRRLELALPSPQKAKAHRVISSVSDHLNKLDEYASAKKVSQSNKEYQALISDLAALLQFSA